MNNNCKEGYHTFERDAFNENRFVCIHCGLERDISIRPPNNNNTPLVFALALLAAYLLVTFNPSLETQVKKQIVNQSQKELINVN
jgi:hypothetical protein